MRHFRALIRLITLLCLVLFGAGVFGGLTYLTSRDRFHPKVVMFFNRCVLGIVGVRVTLIGELPQQVRGILFVGNHCSYLDIPVYGAFIPVCYTPKAEIRRWPVIGQLSIIARSVFIRREKGASAEQKAQLRAELAAGNNILLFPEGTTNDGTEIKPFKTALFGVAEPEEGLPEIPVHPLALSYTAIAGKPPKSGRMLDRVAWYGDMVLVPHLWALLSMRRIEATVKLLPVMHWQGDRKATTFVCEQAVKQALAG